VVRREVDPIVGDDDPLLPLLDDRLDADGVLPFLAGPLSEFRVCRISFLVRGLQLRHLPFMTNPGSSIGMNLKSFFLKHFLPQVTHSPRFFRYSSSCCRVISDPVALKSAPSCSMMTTTTTAMSMTTMAVTIFETK